MTFASIVAKIIGLVAMASSVPLYELNWDFYFPFARVTPFLLLHSVYFFNQQRAKRQQPLYSFHLHLVRYLFSSFI